MRPTIVFARHLQIDGRQFHHGEELAPDLLAPEIIKLNLDRGYLVEVPERRSLFRIFENLTPAERRLYCL